MEFQLLQIQAIKIHFQDNSNNTLHFIVNRLVSLMTHYNGIYKSSYWSGYCDIKRHFKDVNLVEHLFFKDHACNDLKFREMRLTESGKCVLVSKVPVKERNDN